MRSASAPLSRALVALDRERRAAALGVGLAAPAGAGVGRRDQHEAAGQPLRRRRRGRSRPSPSPAAPAAPPARRGGTRRARRGRGRRGGPASPRPGRGGLPPPTRPAGLIVWCGARNGRPPGGAPPSRPQALAIRATSSASLGGQRRQDRGQPARRQRLAGPGRADHQQAVAAGGGDLERVAQVAAGRAGRRGRGRRRRRSSRSGSGCGRGGAHSPAGERRQLAEAVERDHLDARRPAPPRARSRPGRRSPRRPRSRAASAIASAPGTGADRAVERQLADQRQPVAAPPTRAGPRRSAAPPRSPGPSPGPALRRLAGARLATIRRSGNSKPQLTSAARTRSRASRTAVSGRPTTEKAGRPRWTSTSTRTGRAAMPSSVKVCARGEHGADARERRSRAWRARSSEASCDGSRGRAHLRDRARAP